MTCDPPPRWLWARRCVGEGPLNRRAISVGNRDGQSSATSIQAVDGDVEANLLRFTVGYTGVVLAIGDTAEGNSGELFTLVDERWDGSRRVITGQGDVAPDSGVSLPFNGDTF